MNLSNFAPTVLAACALAVAMPSALTAQGLEILLSHSEIVRAHAEPRTVIIGDENIADATIAAGNVVVLTGKAIGTTNLIVLDSAGAELLRTVVEVIPRVTSPEFPLDPLEDPPSSTIRVVRGVVSEQVYVCEPGCVPGESTQRAGTPDASRGAPEVADGNCIYPGDIADDGTRCGDRAATVRPGGRDGEEQQEEGL